jgi:hypothetical protein
VFALKEASLSDGKRSGVGVQRGLEGCSYFQGKVSASITTSAKK